MLKLRPTAYVLTRVIPVTATLLFIGTMLLLNGRADYRALGIVLVALGTGLLVTSFRIVLVVEPDYLVAVNLIRRIRWTWDDVEEVEIVGTSALTPFYLYPELRVVSRRGRKMRLGATILQSERSIQRLWTVLEGCAREHDTRLPPLSDWTEAMPRRF